MLKIAICDDDIPLCSNLEEIVTSHCTKKEIECQVFPFYSGEDLLKPLREGVSYDLIFLDIEIKTMTGIEVGSAIRNELDDNITKIVFVTSKDGYEQALFDVQPLNFIKKPVSMDKVGHCIDLAFKIVKRESMMFHYMVKKEVNLIKIEKILYFETTGKKIKMVTSDGIVTFYGKLLEIYEKYEDSFVFSHKSFLFNLNQANQISAENILMSNGDKIPISRSYGSEIRKKVLQLETEVQYGTL